jgi:hypothetical protein
MQRNSQPLPWRPRGLSDTLDSSDTFAGAMASLQNLIPDPTTKNLWQCRPAAIRATNFSGYVTAQNAIHAGDVLTTGFISRLKVIGNLAYGMVAVLTGNFAGKDAPFCYNLATNTFVGVMVQPGGGSTAQLPTSPATSGAWTPPTMDLIGALLCVTHPGFSGVGNVYFGWFDITNPAAPVWHGGNLTGLVAFTVVPSAVAQYGGRAYYIHNAVAQPAVIFSDTLNAINCTNANQVLTFNDNVPLTALGPLQLNNQLGGVVQSLMVFKGVQNIYQITGDAAINSLSSNALNVATGTLAPQSLAATPKGLAFMAPDGLRVIDFSATVGDPLGMDGQGIAVPFINAVVPSRVCAACNGNVLRMSVQNGAKAGTPFEEYWYDFARQNWHGSHSFPASAIAPWGNTFIEVPQGVLSSLWQSDPVQSSTSSFVENGLQLSWNWQTPFLPDTDQMNNVAVTETSVLFAFGTGTSLINVSALNQNSSVINQVALAQQTSVTTWGSFNWGSAPWGGTLNNLTSYQIPWTQEIVANRLALQLSGQSAQGVKVGSAHLRYQMLRYLVAPLAAA